MNCSTNNFIVSYSTFLRSLTDDVNRYFRLFLKDKLLTIVQLINCCSLSLISFYTSWLSCEVVDFHRLIESPFQFGPRASLLGSQPFNRGVGSSLDGRGQKGQLTWASEQWWLSFSKSVSLVTIRQNDAGGKLGCWHWWCIYASNKCEVYILRQLALLWCSFSVYRTLELWGESISGFWGNLDFHKLSYM